MYESWKKFGGFKNFLKKAKEKTAKPEDSSFAVLFLCFGITKTLSKNR